MPGVLSWKTTVGYMYAKQGEVLLPLLCYAVVSDLSAVQTEYGIFMLGHYEIHFMPNHPLSNIHNV